MIAGMTFEYKDAMQKLVEETINKDPVLLMNSMHEAMKQLKIDADDIPPRTPHDKGPLRASGKTAVHIKDNEISGEVSYNTEYAAIQHEAEEFHHSEPDCGAKYLESKIVNLNQKYLNIVAKPMLEKYK